MIFALIQLQLGPADHAPCSAFRGRRPMLPLNLPLLSTRWWWTVQPKYIYRHRSTA